MVISLKQVKGQYHPESVRQSNDGFPDLLYPVTDVLIIASLIPFRNCSFIQYFKRQSAFFQAVEGPVDYDFFLPGPQTHRTAVRFNLIKG